MRLHRLIVAALLAPAVLGASSRPAWAAPPSAADPALAAILDDYDAFERRVNPIGAGQEGDREALRRLPDDSPAALADEHRRLVAFKAALSAPGVGRLTPADALNRDLLRRSVDDQLEALDLDLARITPIDAYDSFNGAPSQWADATLIRDREDAEAWLARLRALPRYYETEVAQARRGIATGFTQPRPVVEVVLRVAEAQAATPPEADPLLKPFRTLPASIAAEDQARLRGEALAVVRDQIKPAQRAIVAFLRTDYLPHARASLAARDLPNGERYYAWAVRHHTTTAITPDQAHALGLSEVSRIRAEMARVIAESGFKGSFAEWQARLRTDPQFYVTDPQRLLERSALVAKRLDDQVPRWFKTLPRLTFGIRPVPADIQENMTTAYAQFGSAKLGVACGYYVNLSHLDQRPLYEIPVLTAHEAEPGHCFQGNLAQERTDLPRFRRHAYLTAYTEGWGLYSEHVAGEMGMYVTPEERFGQLSYEMWRACRLVADTGIHWLRWSKAQAKRCFEENTSLTPKNIDVEVDRYISWPGQALAYKIGQLKLLELRERARAALGAKFHLPAFHDAVLLDGPLPLDVLEAKITAWIAEQKAG